MKSTEIAFCSFKQFGYLLLHNGGNGDSVELFHLFIHDKAFKCLNSIAFKCLKNQSFFWQFQVTFHMYLNIGRDDDDDYDNGESSDEDCYD